MLIDEEVLAKGAGDRGDLLKWFHFKHAVLRNFGGLEKVDPLKIFEEKLRNVVPDSKNLLQPAGSSAGLAGNERAALFDCDTLSLIQANLKATSSSQSKQFTRYYDAKTHIAFTRYLLLITEDQSTYLLLHQKLFADSTDLEFIFGSKFPKGTFFYIVD